MESNGEWSLFCPNEAPGLAEVWGEEFNQLYTSYEAQGRARKVVRAQQLWFAILEAQIETGNPYMLYKDTCNRKSNQQNLGTIKCSNLCTEIIEYTSPEETAVCNLASIALPRFVKDRDASVSGVRGFLVGVGGWGREWLPVGLFVGVGGQSNASDCCVVEGSAVGLEDGWVGHALGVLLRMPLECGRAEGQATCRCVCMPCLHRASSLVPTCSHDLTLPCVLPPHPNPPLPPLVLHHQAGYENKKLIGSLDAAKRYFDFDKLAEVTRVITNNLNKIIDINYYPVESARRSNMRHRPIGIGVQGLADTFLLLGMPFDSEAAQELNKEIFETIYYAALDTSCDLAKVHGAYETYEGSPVSKGVLQHDMWGVKVRAGGGGSSGVCVECLAHKGALQKALHSLLLCGCMPASWWQWRLVSFLPPARGQHSTGHLSSCRPSPRLRCLTPLCLAPPPSFPPLPCSPWVTAGTGTRCAPASPSTACATACCWRPCPPPAPPRSWATTSASSPTPATSMCAAC